MICAPNPMFAFPYTLHLWLSGFYTYPAVQHSGDVGSSVSAVRKFIQLVMHSLRSQWSSSSHDHGQNAKCIDIWRTPHATVQWSASTQATWFFFVHRIRFWITGFSAWSSFQTENSHLSFGFFGFLVPGFFDVDVVPFGLFSVVSFGFFDVVPFGCCFFVLLINHFFWDFFFCHFVSCSSKSLVLLQSLWACHTHFITHAWTQGILSWDLEPLCLCKTMIKGIWKWQHIPRVKKMDHANRNGLYCTNHACGFSITWCTGLSCAKQHAFSESGTNANHLSCTYADIKFTKSKWWTGWPFDFKNSIVVFLTGGPHGQSSQGFHVLQVLQAIGANCTRFINGPGNKIRHTCKENIDIHPCWSVLNSFQNVVVPPIFGTRHKYRPAFSIWSCIWLPADLCDGIQSSLNSVGSPKCLSGDISDIRAKWGISKLVISGEKMAKCIWGQGIHAAKSADAGERRSL